MTDWIGLANFAIAVSALTVAALGLALTVSIRYVERWNRRFFALLFTLLAAYIGSDLLAQISLLQGAEGSAAASQAATFFESLFSSMAMPMLTLYLLRCVGEDRRHSNLYAVVTGLWLVYFALLVVTQFTAEIYYFTPDNVYHRGPWYPVLLLPPALLMAINAVALWRRRDRLTRRQLTALLSYVVVPLIAMLIQMTAYGLYTIVAGTAVAELCMFLFILLEQVERYVRAREENANQRASIRVLQMRPHFIYNTMMSIYYLCAQDAERAQRVVLDFTQYLRANFTAIAKEDAIPFEEELAHTRAYLAVEQVRFEGRLFVAFDTPHTLFRVPPLTLQPIVENAVKYGVDPEREPLHIMISTRKTERGSEIAVTDDGPGFSDADSGGTHIALSNIRERLELMCGGTLEVSPNAGGGAVVTVFVPDAAE